MSYSQMFVLFVDNFAWEARVIHKILVDNPYLGITLWAVVCLRRPVGAKG
jgi:hypothetical protein